MNAEHEQLLKYKAQRKAARTILWVLAAVSFAAIALSLL